METNPAKDKMMKGPPAKKNLREYFFAGSGTYHPLTVMAESIEDATAQWEQQKRLVEEPLSTPTAEEGGAAVQ